MSSDTSSDPFAGFELWYYTPSIAAAAIFTAIFIVLSGVHGWKLVKTRTWFCIPFLIGAIFEAIGYAARAAAHNNTSNLTIYIIQTLLILISPALFAASVYMILGRLIRACRAESYSIIPTKWLTKIFVGGDVLCFFVQSAGGGLTAKATDSAGVKKAENIILGGLVLQVVVFGVFVVVAAIFHSRLLKRPTAISLEAGFPWQRFMIVLYVVSVLITTRNIFRIIEYAAGKTGYLLTHEWTLYIFDALLMATTLSICLICYVSALRPRYDSKDGHDLEQHEYHAKINSSA